MTNVAHVDFPFDGREVRRSRYLRTELCNFLHVALVYKYGPILRRFGYLFWVGF